MDNPTRLDIRRLPHVTIVDLYTKDGKHQKSTMSTPDGTVLYEEGRHPSKDVGFLSQYYPQAPWLKEWRRT